VCLTTNFVSFRAVILRDFIAELYELIRECKNFARLCFQVMWTHYYTHWLYWRFESTYGLETAFFTMRIIYFLMQLVCWG